MRSSLLVVVLCAANPLAGCNKERIPFLGHWDGGFVVSSTSTPTPTSALNLRGYIQLYRTGDKFLIELSNPTQVLDLGGKWRMLNGKRVELTFNSFRLTEADLNKLKAMRRPYLDPTDLKSAYTKPLILDLSSDGKTLTGLLMRTGPLLGKHEFRKGE